MKRIGLIIAFFIVVIVIIPLATVKSCSNKIAINQTPPEQPGSQIPERIQVYVSQADAVREFDFQEYLKGVVSAEMPASYHDEALKAQAVAARTYILRKIVDNNAPPEHKGAPVCSNPSHCKAWLSDEEIVAKWGQNWMDNYKEKVSACVDATNRKILVYDDQPIRAVFHSMSSGRTEDAKDVWGSEIPYLRSVDSPGEETARDFETAVNVSFDEFKMKIIEKYPSCRLNSAADIGEITQTEAGGAGTVHIGGVDIKGTEIRAMFGLRSAHFQLTASNEQISFVVRGYGHGVGMSQTGANNLAQSGSSYDEILTYYYQDTAVIER